MMKVTAWVCSRVNHRQTPRDRRRKRQFLIDAGASRWQADRARDWTVSHMMQFVETNLILNSD